jgi:hypothetical protein
VRKATDITQCWHAGHAHISQVLIVSECTPEAMHATHHDLILAISLFMRELKLLDRCVGLQGFPYPAKRAILLSRSKLR